MPKISIREIDSTGGETLEYLNYTVLVPGVRLCNKITDTKTGIITLTPVEGLFTSARDLAKYNLVAASLVPGSEDNPTYTETTGYKIETDIGFIYLYGLLKRGLSVYYAPAYEVSIDDVTHKVTKTLIGDEKEFFKEFADKGKYDLRFISLGGITEGIKSSDAADSNPFENANIAAIKCAGDRGDAVAVLSVPEHGYIKNSTSGEKELVSLNDSTKIDTWVNNTFGEICATEIIRKGVTWTGNEEVTETYGRYAAIFTPNVGFKLLINEERIDVTLPASYDYLACFATYIRKYPSWYAMSGSVRGVSPYLNLETKLKFGDADVDLLEIRTAKAKKEGEDKKEGEGHIATNPICNIRPYGNIIWGNRTMHPLSKPLGEDEAEIQLTASSFLNIRHLCCDIKKTLYRASRQLTFEPNSDVVWFKFKSLITPLLDKMKSNNGIRSYKIMKLPTKKKAVCVAVIKISPIEALEDFDLTVELADSVEVTE